MGNYQKRHFCGNNCKENIAEDRFYSLKQHVYGIMESERLIQKEGLDEIYR